MAEVEEGGREGMGALKGWGERQLGGGARSRLAHVVERVVHREEM